MLRRFLYAALGFSLVMGSCNKTTVTPASTASMMFVNGCIPSTALAFNADAYINSTAVSGASGIAILKNSGYKAVAVGTDSVTFNTSGAVIAGGSLATTLSSSYSAFLGGSAYSPFVILQSDDLSAPATGNVKIRFVNLSPQNLNESCYYGTTKVDSNVAYKSITPFFQVPAGTVNILMQDPANPTMFPTNLQSQTFTAGKIYTVMITGLWANTGSTGLTYTLINNN